MTKKGNRTIYWSEAEDARLRQARANGLTVTTIAKVMFRSESSINTRIKRLGLAKVLKKSNKALKCGVYGSGYDPRPKVVKRPEEAFIAYGTPKMMLELGPMECRFHVEDKGFCAAKCGGRYCHDHERICYV